MVTSLDVIKAITGERVYTQSRRQVDGRKDWLFKLADGKKEIVLNEITSERSLCQMRLLLRRLTI